jgi:hypothetical protein
LDTEGNLQLVMQHSLLDMQDSLLLDTEDNLLDILLSLLAMQVNLYKLLSYYNSQLLIMLRLHNLSIKLLSSNSHKALLEPYKPLDSL